MREPGLPDRSEIKETPHSSVDMATSVKPPAISLVIIARCSGPSDVVDGCT